MKHYQGKDIAKEYAMIEEEQKKKAVDDWERSHASAVTGAGSGFLTSMFGSVGGVSLNPIAFRAELTCSPDDPDRTSR